MGPMATVAGQFGGLLHTLHNGRMIARNRRLAYEAEVHAGRVAEDEEAAVIMLIEALRAAKSEAAREKAKADRERRRADDLARRLARLELASLKRL